MSRFLKGLGIFLALVSVGVISAFAVVALLLRQEEVRVPDLAGQDLVSVLDTVSQLGLQLKVDRREPHPTLPRDSVLSQTPAPGGGIKKGRQVHVVVSQGPSDMQAPKLVGEHFRKADITIRQAGFSPGDISRVSSETVEREMVIAQDPQAGNQLDRGGRVNLLVSTGRSVQNLIMPKLVGKSAEEAVKTADRMGMLYRVTSRASATNAQAGDRVVVSQKPVAGHSVAPDVTVEIVVNR